MSAPTTTRRRIYNATGTAYEAGRYGDPHMDEYRGLRNDTLASLIAQRFGDRPLRVLEVGCGTGPSLEHLSRSGGRHRLFGVDASDTMLRQAADRAYPDDRHPALALADGARVALPARRLRRRLRHTLHPPVFPRCEAQPLD